MTNRPASRLTPAKTEQRQKALKSLELRRAGHTWTVIAERVGYTTATSARRAAERVMTRLETDTGQEVLTLELDRLEALTQTYWGPARSGEEKAAELVLKIMERRAKLCGLDRNETRAAQAAETQAAAAIIQAQEMTRLVRLIFVRLGYTVEQEQAALEILHAELVATGIIEPPEN